MTTTDPSAPTGTTTTTDPTTTPPATTSTDPGTTGTTTPPATTTDPTPSPLVSQLAALVTQIETDLSAFSDATAKASASAQAAAVDAAAAVSAQQIAHTDIAHLGMLVAQLDPGAPGAAPVVAQAQAAFRKFSGIRSPR